MVPLKSLGLEDFNGITQFFEALLWFECITLGFSPKALLKSLGLEVFALFCQEQRFHSSPLDLRSRTRGTEVITLFCTKQRRLYSGSFRLSPKVITSGSARTRAEPRRTGGFCFVLLRTKVPLLWAKAQSNNIKVPPGLRMYYFGL